MKTKKNSEELQLLKILDIMQHSKMDYVSEMNRLFPSTDLDVFNSPLSPSFNQSTVIVGSSSSTDTSPESFPDLAARYHAMCQSETAMDYRPQQPKRFDNHFNLFTDPDNHRYEMAMTQEVPDTFTQIQETPYVARHQRPIVGRKLMATPEYQSPKTEEIQWPEEFVPYTPQNNIQVDQRKYYELFPSEHKSFEFKTPMKTSPKYTTSAKMLQNPNMSPHTGYQASRVNVSPRMSPNMRKLSPTMTLSPSMGNVPPSMANMSPRMANMPSSMTNMPSSMTNMSPSRTNRSPSMTMSPSTSQRLPESPNKKSPPMSQFSPRFPAFKEPLISTNFRPNTGSKMCTFCRKNGETPLVYMTHAVKEKVGQKNVVTCPILRSHVCSTCGASGDNAHTITYCPILRDSNNGQPLQSTTITLKNTRIKSNGRRRF